MNRAWTVAGRLVAGGAVGLLALASCSSGTSSGSTGAARTSSASSSNVPAQPLGSAAAGSLTVSGAYIPEPASPDVAAAYLTVTDHSGAGDTLTGASSPAAASVQLHETVENGNTGSMVPLSRLPVPPGGSVTFQVGQRHLMLMSPPEPLTLGEHVTITLTFAKAGKVSVSVPVVAATGPQDGDTTGAPMPGMPGMSG